MYNGTLQKQNLCDVCTGCGRCGKPASSMRVLDFYTRKLPPRANSGKIPEGKDSNASPEKNTGIKYIAVADIGTTTIAMQLRNTGTGEIIDTYTTVNPQRKYGLDVLTRIMQVNEHGKKGEMKQTVQEVLHSGLEQFQKTCPEIELFVIAANTTMVHLAFGLDVSHLGEAPFLAETLDEIHMKFAGIDTVVMPGCDAFVGGDILAGMYACNLDRTEQVTLFLDLGTNGEMALGNREKIIATATALAPAFEGGATTGVWGADMISITSRLLEEGIMDETGLLAEPYFEEGVKIAGITMKQEQIRSLQMAKGAVCAGIEILCERYGLTSYDRIEKVYLAGGFGYYLDSKAAVRIGLLPKELEGKVCAVGNSALEGAFLYGKNLLLDAQTKQDLQDLRELTTVINLAKQPEFQNLYLEALNFPAEL